jgi:hypothetical protein
MVVGYQTKDTVSGFNFIAPTFEKVSDSGVDIQDIKLVGDATEYSDSIQILDDGGATTETYLWTADGWIDLNTFEAANKSLNAGSSVLIDTANAIKVTMSGKVGTESYDTTSVAGFNFVGNTTPVAIDIQSIKLEGDATEYSDSIQVLDEGGATVETYLWTATGWIDMNTFEDASKTIDAGQGLLIDTANAGVKISFPSAL